MGRSAGGLPKHGVGRARACATVITAREALVLNLRLPVRVRCTARALALVQGLKLFALLEGLGEEFLDGFLFEAARATNAGVTSMVDHGLRRLG